MSLKIRFTSLDSCKRSKETRIEASCLRTTCRKASPSTCLIGNYDCVRTNGYCFTASTAIIRRPPFAPKPYLGLESLPDTYRAVFPCNWRLERTLWYSQFSSDCFKKPGGGLTGTENCGLTREPLFTLRRMDSKQQPNRCGGRVRVYCVP